MLTFILIASVLNAIGVLYVCINVTALLSADDEHEYSYDADSVEQRYSAWVDEYDQRIADLRAEIHAYGTDADVVHPDVHNIPHHEHDKKLNQLPDVEISE